VPVAIGAAVALLWRIVALFATPEPLRRIPAIDPLTAVPYLSALERTMAGVGAQVGILLLPLKLSHDYSWLLTARWWAIVGLTTLADLLIVAGIWGIVRSKRSWPLTPLIVIALAPLVAPALLPSLCGTAASERNLYLALPGWIGLLLLAGRAVLARREGLGPLLAGVAVGIALLLGVRTILRVPTSRIRRPHAGRLPELSEGSADSLRSWQREALRGDDAGAQKYYEQALELRPTSVSPP